MNAPFTLEQHQNYPIYILTLTQDYVFERDLPKTSEVSLKLLNSLQEQVFWIAVNTQTLTLEDMLIATKSIAGDERSVWRHPRIRQVIMVTDNAILKDAAKGFSSSVFGSLNVHVASSVDEALDYAKAQLTQS